MKLIKFAFIFIFFGTSLFANEVVYVVETIGRAHFIPEVTKGVKQAFKNLKESHDYKFGKSSPFKSEWDIEKLKSSQMEYILSSDLEKSFADVAKVIPLGITNKEFIISYVLSRVLYWQTKAYLKYPFTRQARVKFAMAQVYDQMGVARGCFECAKDYFDKHQKLTIDFSKAKTTRYYDIASDFIHSDRKDSMPILWGEVSVEWNKKNKPKSQKDLQKLVIESLNDFYIPQIFRKVFQIYGERNSYEYKRAFHFGKPAPREVRKYYLSLTDGRSAKQRYVDQMKINWSVSELSYSTNAEDIRKKFQAAKKRSLQNLKQEFGLALRKLKQETGSFDGANEILSGLRKKHFQILSEDLAIESKPQIQSYSQKGSADDFKEELSDTEHFPFVFNLIKDYQKNGRVLFPIFFADYPNKEKEGGVFKIYLLSDYQVVKHLDLKKVYTQLEQEMWREKTNAAQVFLASKLFHKAFYPTEGETVWSFSPKEKEKLLMTISAQNVEKLIWLAGLIESKRVMQEGKWRYSLGMYRLAPHKW